MDPILNTLFFKTLTGVSVGLTLGSFATMLSYRLPRKLSIVAPPSSCPKCGARLGPRDLVPVFSWVFSKGKCRHCAAPVSARYPLIELITTAAVTAAFIGFGFSLALLPALFGIVVLVTLATMAAEKSR